MNKNIGTADKVYFDFLFAPTLSKKLEIIVENKTLMKSDSPYHLKGMFDSMESNVEFDMALINWNCDVLTEFSLLFSQDTREEEYKGLVQKKIRNLERLGLMLDVLSPPTLGIFTIASALLSEMPNWKEVNGDKLYQGALLALCHISNWLKELQRDDRNYISKVSDILDEGLSAIVPAIENKIRGESVRFLFPYIECVQREGKYSLAGNYALLLAKYLAEIGETLPAAAICASVAPDNRNIDAIERFEIGGYASSYLGEHVSRDTSNALLLLNASRALVDLREVNNERVVSLLDQAIGECRALFKQNPFRHSVEFYWLNAKLHLDRAVRRLDVDDAGHWLALEDYCEAIKIFEELEGRFDSERENVRLQIIGSIIIMQYEAKKNSHVYTDQELIDDLSKAVSIAESIGNTELLSSALKERAAQQLNLSREATLNAKKDYLRVLDILEEDESSAFEIYAQLGCCLIAIGGASSVKEASSYFLRSIRWYEQELTDRPSSFTAHNLARNWMNLAVARILDPDESGERAFGAYKKAINILEKCDPIHTREPEYAPDQHLHLLVKCYMQAGSICMLLSDVSKWEYAIEVQSRAIEILSKKYSDTQAQCSTEWCDDLAGAYFNRSQLWMRRGSVYRKYWKKDVDSAIDVRLRVLKSFGTNPPVQSIKRLGSTILSRTHFSGDQFTSETARSALIDCAAVEKLLRQLSSEEIKEPNCNQLRFEMFDLMANSYEVLGDSESELSASLKAASAINDLPDDAWTNNRLLRFNTQHVTRLAREGEYDKSADLLLKMSVKRAISYSMSMTRAGKKNAINEGQNIGGLGAWVLSKAGRYKEALQFAEENRGFLLRDAIFSDAEAIVVQSGVAKHDAERVSVLHRKLICLQLKLANIESVDLADVDTLSLREGIENTFDKLNKEINSLGLDHVINPLCFDEISGLSPVDGVLVIPATSALGTVVFFVTKRMRADDLAVLILPKLTKSTLNQWWDIFCKAESNFVEKTMIERTPAIGEFEKDLLDLSEKLWTDLIGPISNYIEKQLNLVTTTPITFVTQGTLDSLPIHIASRFVDGCRRYLIEDRTVRFSPGLSSLKMMHSSSDKKHNRPANIVGFINPTGDLSYAEKKEWPIIQSLNWSSPPIAFVGPEQATVSNLKKIMQQVAENKQVTHMHLSMHGYFNSEHPELSGLIFSTDDIPDSLLSVADVLRLPSLRGLEFICLSTCQSGQSDVCWATDEFIGLVSAFIQVGVGSILATLYPILDETSPEIIYSIYREMLESRHSNDSIDVAQALRNTVISLRRGKGNTHPESMSLDESSQVTTDIEFGRDLSVVDWAAFKPICY